MALDDQRFKDHCLIIVGNGGKADEVLAKRRLAAGGRLAHFLTRPDDPRVTFSASADGLEYDFFTWQPPKGTMGISSFARKLQGKPRTFWTKTGPPVFDSVSRAPSPPPPAASLTHTLTHSQLCHIASLTYNNFTYNNFTHTHTHTHNFVT